MEELIQFGNSYNWDFSHKDLEGFLRPSLASLLLYMAERMKLPCDDEVFYDKDGNSFSNPRTLLIEEARKITDGV